MHNLRPGGVGRKGFRRGYASDGPSDPVCGRSAEAAARLATVPW